MNIDFSNTPINKPEFQSLCEAQRAIMAATLDKARLQEALDRVTEYVREQNEDMYRTIAQRFLADIGMSTESWLITEVE